MLHIIPLIIYTKATVYHTLVKLKVIGNVSFWLIYIYQLDLGKRKKNDAVNRMIARTDKNNLGLGSYVSWS